MGKFQFWATLITAFVLGLVGFILGGILPLPFIDGQSRAFYALLGVLLGLLTFVRFSSWMAAAFARLAARLMARLAGEVAHQVTRATSRGLTLLPGRREAEEPANPDYSKWYGATILDTSSIIDGRILEVAEAGFLSGQVLIPSFVLRELQQVADSVDSLKRSRGRRGFEVVSRLKKVRGVKVKVWDKEVPGKAVDDCLVELGKNIKGKILTCDFNLNRVAKLEGVVVLNLNELANALKALPVPGETLTVKLVHVGKDPDQGVGYLSDGTMVVIQDAATLVGDDLEVEVTKVLQGSAGRMIFGKIADSSLVSR